MQASDSKSAGEENPAANLHSTDGRSDGEGLAKLDAGLQIDSKSVEEKVDAVANAIESSADSSQVLTNNSLEQSSTEGSMMQRNIISTYRQD